MPTPLIFSGRIVWGHPAIPRDVTDDNGKPVLGPDGKPKQQYSFGVAQPKAEFVGTSWPAFSAEASRLFPNAQVPGRFSWKFKDADTAVDPGGKLYSLREGQAGCYVIAVSSNFPIKMFKLEGAAYRQLEQKEIKTGDYVAVNVNLEVHGSDPKIQGGGTPGMYINPNGVELLGYGVEIVSGPDAQTMFGGVQRALPAGASATPVMSPNAPIMPGSAPIVPSAAPGAPALPPGLPGAVPAPAPVPMAAPAVTPTVPGAVPVPAIPAGLPAPAPIASPSNPPGGPVAPVQPAPDFVAAVAAAPARVPAGYDAGTGKPYYLTGYDPATGQPIYGW